MRVTVETRARWVASCFFGALVGVGLVFMWDGPRVVLLVLIAVAFASALVVGMRNVPHVIELTDVELLERRGRRTQRIALSQIRGAEVTPVNKAHPAVWILGPGSRVGPLSLGEDNHRLLVRALAREIHAHGLAHLLKGDLVRATFDPRRDPDQMPEGWIGW